jgi:hypothetical protein
MTNAVNIAQGGSNNVTMRNRLINGNMTIAQRTTGPLTGSNGAYNYVVDRFPFYTQTGSYMTGQQSSSAPAGFNYSLLLTSTGANTPGANDEYELYHKIEGYNAADLGWGTSSAKSITLSFWVNCSLTGTFSVAFSNNSTNRSYVATYTISSANTWTYVTLTVPGCTDGTWLTTNGIGIYVIWNLADGSSYDTTTPNTWLTSFKTKTSSTVNFIGTTNATFYLTGAQFEAGTTASPFEYRQYGTELVLCQRYYQKISASSGGGYQMYATGSYESANTLWVGVPLKVTMRAQPTFAINGSLGLSYGTAGTIVTDTNQTGPDVGVFGWSTGSGGLAGQSTFLRSSANTAGFISFIAEL